ncbi:hypothetical protein PENANT_c001G03462 [Penicillium antarcticum]|uniref:Uncharacterized protein n=1 Tax=Penicillium antarcticum TaxID=416450 RepID=A0A1V6QP36_9EURO|nr:uncharacterized protein N7508_010399 [Penicillium antarcticum]KAJ5295578.1 hypothetical protein N7508_010399 [Penicillium antarcticum]OQD90747.1 hypothetical protein PENANT_c001G03462 [Penicillium antarcticum]
MAALKKLFLAEKHPRPVTSLGFEGSPMRDPYFHMTVDSPARSHFGDFPSSASQSLDVAHHFDQIEKQFEDLHDSLQRPISAESEMPPLGATDSTARPQNGRHIDLMDAITTSEPPQTIQSEPVSPLAGPYNEDVAERNMTRFLRIQYRNGLASSRILAALYQEDVADRNIAKYSKDSRTLSNLSSQSSPAAPGRVRIPDGVRRKARKRDHGKPTWASAENLRRGEDSRDDGSGTSSQGSSSQDLRHQRSAPSLSADEGFVSQENAPPSPVQRLGVPPVYKLGKRWSNTPLPDSPTIPIPMGDRGGAAEAPSVPRSPAIISRSSSSTSRSHSSSPPPPPAPGSKKNVRDLSINTKLASKGRPKIAHRAIQPPTPSTGSMKRAPSIAEVMNSPLPVPSPASPPKESPRFKASELMDLFSKAFTSIPGNHPTYETLQDAIVREINSHEAFRRVPVPAPGPPFTPISENDRFAGAKHEPGLLSRNASAKGRLASKGSFRKHKRNSESRRSISSSVGYDKIRRKVAGSPARRRHTDAPPPTPGFLADIKPQESIAPRLVAGEPITYMDVLRASNDIATSAPNSKMPAASRKRGRSESAGTLATLARTAPDAPSTPGTIYCLQAHSTPSASDSQEDSDDDDIIHLPSVNMAPRVQIEGVDENNVRYVIDAASDEAQKFMHWPQRTARGVNRNAYENSLSPSSPARMQLRGSRSVEAY